eukprot:9360590-Alexandrium_andersonii.AAC.1
MQPPHEQTTREGKRARMTSGALRLVRKRSERCGRFPGRNDQSSASSDGRLATQPDVAHGRC